MSGHSSSRAGILLLLLAHPASSIAPARTRVLRRAPWWVAATSPHRPMAARMPTRAPASTRRWSSSATSCAVPPLEYPRAHTRTTHALSAWHSAARASSPHLIPRLSRRPPAAAASAQEKTGGTSLRSSFQHSRMGRVAYTIARVAPPQRPTRWQPTGAVHGLCPLGPRGDREESPLPLRVVELPHMDAAGRESAVSLHRCLPREGVTHPCSWPPQALGLPVLRIPDVRRDSTDIAPR